MTQNPNALAAVRYEPPHPAEHPARAEFVRLLHEHEDIQAELLRVAGISKITDEMVERVARELSAEDGGFWDKHPKPIRDNYLHIAHVLLRALLATDADGGANLTERYRMSWRKIVAAYDHASITCQPAGSAVSPTQVQPVQAMQPVQDNSAAIPDCALGGA